MGLMIKTVRGRTPEWSYAQHNESFNLPFSRRSNLFSARARGLEHLLFGAAIAINPTKDAAIFIGMNQVGADPAEKAVKILRRLP